MTACPSQMCSEPTLTHSCHWLCNRVIEVEIPIHRRFQARIWKLREQCSHDYLFTLAPGMLSWNVPEMAGSQATRRRWRHSQPPCYPPHVLTGMDSITKLCCLLTSHMSCEVLDLILCMFVVFGGVLYCIRVYEFMTRPHSKYKHRVKAGHSQLHYRHNTRTSLSDFAPHFEIAHVMYGG